MKTQFIQVCGVLLTQILTAAALLAQTPFPLSHGPRELAVPRNCGLRSLYQVAQVLRPNDRNSVASWIVPGSGAALSMAELVRLSESFQLGLVPMERISGDELPVPSVAHWGNNHFIAILDRDGSDYRIFDPALGNARLLPAEQVNAGISGQFLAPAGQLNENWRRLSVAEADAISGSVVIYVPYNAYDDGDENCPKDEFKNDEKCPTGRDGDRCRPGNNQPDDAGCSACGTGADHSGFAMPVWKVSEPFINLWVIDKPMFYTTSLDNLIVFKLTYKQRNSQPVGRTNFFGVGVGWECNWRAYVEPDITQTNVQRLASIDGGGRTYSSTSCEGNTCSASESMSLTQALMDTNRTTISGNQGGSWNYSQEFVTSDGSVVRFPSERVDVQGRTNRFVYATNQFVLQLVQYIDGEGRTNFLRYQNTNLPANVTEVENPYRRTATLKYDSQGFLTNIVDMIGFTNSFQYDSAGLITNMTTPYGTTTFQAITNKAGSYDFGGDNAVNRALRVTEPNNGKQLFLYRQYANNLNGTNATPLIPAFYPSEQVPLSDPFPNLFENSNLYERNSFYWGRQQYAALSEAFRTNAFTLDNLNNLSTNDYNLARLRHWLYRTNGTIGQTLSLERSPSPDGVTEGQKVWYDYPGKGSDTRVEGTNAWPSLVARVLPDGTTQFRYLEYNGWWNPTKMVTTYSTVGTNVYFRTNTLGYWGAGIDLGSVFDQDNNLLLGLGNYLDHLPRLLTNALSEVTTLTIDATNRQVTSIKWPSGLTTTNIYFTSGATNFLQQTTDLETTNSILFTYDKALVNTFTDVRGLQVTLNWDALERLTNAVFPNGTVTLAYNKLDLSTFTDRLTNNYNFTYNSIRQMTQAVDPLTRTNTYSYCDCGNLNSITDPLGRTTSFFYDTAGRRTNVVYPGSSTGYSINNFYSQVGRLTNVTDNAGNSVTNWYSNQGLPIASSNAFGQVFKSIYDHKNRATNSVSADGVGIDQTFDNLNRLLTRKWPDNGIEKFFYTPRGLTNYTDQLTNITHFYYNEAGWLTKRLNLTSAGTPVETNRFEYQQSGDLLRLYDGKNQLTTWAYDQYRRGKWSVLNIDTVMRSIPQRRKPN